MLKLPRVIQHRFRVALMFTPLAFACGGVTERPRNEPDCSAEDPYEFSTPILDAEQGSPHHPDAWFGSSDTTPNCRVDVADGVPVGNLTFVDGGQPKIDASVCTVREPTIRPLTPHLIAPDDPNNPTVVTPVHRAIVFHSEGCTFWGSNASQTGPDAPVNTGTAGCLYWQAPKLEQPTGWWDGSDYDGIAFWARTPGVSNHSVYLSFNNADTQVVNRTSCNYPRTPAQSRCVNPPTDATAGLGFSVVDYQSGTATAGGVQTRIPQVGECGNAFQHYLETTPDWQFYTLPFDSLWQLPYPNRIPTGFDASTLLQIAVVFPKEVRTELWIANFRFYRQKGSHSRDADAGTP